MSFPRTPKISHTLFLFFFLIFFSYVSSNLENTLSTDDFLTPSRNRTIVSRNKMFELGFFKLDGRWYLGMWYKAILKKEYVWVANRNNPLLDSSGILKLSNTNLVLEDQFGTAVWFTNVTFRPPQSPVVAELHDNGNFVLRYSTNDNNNPEAFLWQSFDYPTDTLLAEMKLGWDKKSNLNRKLTSWKSQDDPSSGDYSYVINFHGLPQSFLLKKDTVTHRSDPSWKRVDSSGILASKQTKYVAFNITTTEQEVTYSFTATDDKVYSKLIMSYKGQVERLVLSPTTKEWSSLWHAPTDACDKYAKCGANSVCDMGISSKCDCIKGFEPKNDQAWRFQDMKNGCKRRKPLSCGGDGFHQLRKVKLPDTKAAILDWKIGSKECRLRCLDDCNCTGYANLDTQNHKGSVCLIWRAELLDIRTFTVDGEDLFVRLAPGDLEEGSKSRKFIDLIVASTVIFILSVLILWFWKRKQKRASAVARNTTALQLNGSSSRIDLWAETEEDLPLRMDFKSISMATNNFASSSKLGQGGFGIVYKGRLLDGKVIAVKRLTEMSDEGRSQFRNEVNLIAKLQHVNLVQLIGYCNDGEENLLIYEYMENLSLSSYIFDNTQRFKLNGQRRIEIINGIARGLVYLHQDSRLKIIHRDLKASNILLDEDMIPKISDFGMARLIGREDSEEGSEARTMEVAGTYGYLSPEYLRDGVFSVKSDVFSFGVILVEILTGKRNWKFKSSNGDWCLLIHVWKHWEAGTLLEIVDPCIVDLSTFQTQVLRCFQIALLCVEQNAEDRPTMPSVVVMLGSEAAIPQPKPFSWWVRQSSFIDTASSLSTNDVSVFEPR